MSCEINSRFQNNRGEYLEDCYQHIPNNKGLAKGTKSSRYLNVNRDGNINRPLPILYNSAEDCCGCSACYAICPLSGQDSITGETIQVWNPANGGRIIDYLLTGAITMLPDAEGFMYPVVDASVCIRCYCCVNCCAFKTFERQDRDKDFD